MSDLTSSGAIIDKAGSNLWVLWEVTDVGALASAWASYGIGSIKETSQDDKTSKTNYPNESGKTEKTDFEYDTTVTGIIMDTSKALIDFLSETVKGKYYGLYRRRNSVDGKTQEWFYPVGQVTPQSSVKSPGGAASMPFEYTSLDHTAAITIATTTLVSIGAYVTAAVTLAAGVLKTITEV